MSRPVEPLYAIVGTRVRVAREAAELSQEQLAAAVGLTRTSITNLEMGRQQTPLHTLYAIAHALNLPLKDLLPDYPEKVPQPLDTIGAEEVERWEAMVRAPGRNVNSR